MTTRMWKVIGIGGVLATLGAGCANTRQEGSNPMARQIRGSQQQSQEALDRAQQAQQRASDQQKRVAQAQADVDGAQRQLTEAQRRLRQEQAKAEQLQLAANQATQDSARQAQQAQQQATRALREQGKQVARNEQVIQGTVVGASGDRLSVRPAGGRSLTFGVTDRTRVTVNGQTATLADVLQGADARVAYEPSSTMPTAISIDVSPSGTMGAMPHGAPPAGSSPGTGERNDQPSTPPTPQSSGRGY